MRYRNAFQTFALAILISCTTSELGYDETDLIFKGKKSLEVEVIEEGWNANFDLPAQNRGIKNNDDLEEFWNDLNGQGHPPPKIPEIDFQKNMLLVSVLGRRGIGGISLQIDKVVDFKDMLAVRVKTISPKNCAVPTVMTNPFFIAKVEKSELPIEFFETQEFNDCSE